MAQEMLPPNPVAAHITGTAPRAPKTLPANPVAGHVAGHPNPSGAAVLRPAGPVASATSTEPYFAGQAPIHTPLQAARARQPYLGPVYAKPDGDTGFDAASHLTPAQQAEAAHLREQNLGKTAVVARGVAGAVGDLTGVPQAVKAVAHGDVKHGLEAAALFVPPGKLLRGVEDAARVAKLVGELDNGAKTAGRLRTGEEAHAHLLDASARAKAEGFGGHPGGMGHPPIVEKGVATPETGGALGQQIRESLLHAPNTRAVQKEGYSEERGLKVAAAAEAHQQAGGGIAGHLAAKRHLEGSLGKEFFGHLKHFTPEQVDEAARVVEKAPLQFFEKHRAVDAIRNAVDHGVAPTESDQALLERVFGKVGSVGDQPDLSSFWDKFVSYTNIPRALRSSADVSAGLRQGLLVLLTHPKVWGRQFAKSIESFGSENFYQAQNAAIHNDPLFPLFEKWKVPFTDIGGKVANTEEAYIGGQAAEHLHELPGIKGTPIGGLLRPVSNVIRRSDRAFTGFQNGTRFEMAKMLAEKASLLGHDLNDEKLGTSIGKVVGTFTGRGVTPKILEGHLTTMNALMFSPRLMASRLNLLSPVYYKKLDPFARAEAMRGARNLVAAIGTVMVVAKMMGAEVNFDPRSSNFTKIKIGNTRIDIAGGFSQYVRFVAQEMTRTAISSAGHRQHIGWGPNDTSDLSNLTKLGRSKAAPIPSLLWDEASGKDFIGQPVKQGHEAWANAPFLAQDTVNATQISGPRTAVVAAFLSAIGLGVQTYKDKPVVPATGGGGGDGYGGSSDYGDSGGYGDGSGYGQSGGYGG